MKQTTCIDDIKCPACGYKFDGADAVNHDMSLMSTDVWRHACGAGLDIMISVEYTATVREDERDG